MCACHFVCSTSGFRVLCHAMKDAFPVQACLMDSLLFGKQLNAPSFNLAVPTAIITFVPSFGLLSYAPLARCRVRDATRTESALPASSSASLPMLSRSPVVFCVMKYVTWSLDFAYWLLLNLENALGPFGGRGRWQWRSLARLPFLTQYILYSPAVFGAAGHNRGGTAERQPLARTQGRNLDRCLTFLCLLRRV